MTTPKTIQGFAINPELDLVLERTIDVPVELVWKVWTTPEHLLPWFCPKPWQTVACEIDLRPGGNFSTTMRSPEGQDYPNSGCFLEVIPNQRLTWTSAMTAGFRPVAPANPHELLFTGVIALEPHGKGTKYTAIAIHPTPETAKRHDEMGFQDGWGTCATQLEAYIKETLLK